MRGPRFTWGAEVESVVGFVDAERAREFARSGAEVTRVGAVAGGAHVAQTVRGFEGAQENEARLFAADTHIEHPVHAVIEIDVGGAGRVRREKGPRARSPGRVAGIISTRGIRLGLDNNPPAPPPAQNAAQKGLGTHLGGTVEKRAREPSLRLHSPLGWSMKTDSMRKRFATCAARAFTPNVSVA